MDVSLGGEDTSAYRVIVNTKVRFCIFLPHSVSLSMGSTLPFSHRGHIPSPVTFTG